MATETISEWYLRTSGGDVKGFRTRLADGQGIGQAFYNSCTEEDRMRLLDGPHFPYGKGMDATHRAIDFLTGGVA